MPSNAPLGEHTPPVSEEKIPKPLSPYGASKLACEAYCSAFYTSYGLKTINFRFSNAYGPHCLHKSSVIAKFIKDGLLKELLERKHDIESKEVKTLGREEVFDV